MWLDVEILKDLIIEMGGSVKFNSPLTVKMTPHTHPIIITGVRIEDDFIIASGDILIEVSEPSALCNSLIQRLNLIKNNL